VCVGSRYTLFYIFFLYGARFQHERHSQNRSHLVIECEKLFVIGSVTSAGLGRNQNFILVSTDGLDSFTVSIITVRGGVTMTT
jgi:hypothetical protein